MSFQFRAIGLFTIPSDGIPDGNISRCSSIAETLVSKNRDYPLLVWLKTNPEYLLNSSSKFYNYVIGT